MGKVRVAGFAVSIDGFAAGPDQSLDHPLGKRGGELMSWFYPSLIRQSRLRPDGERHGRHRYILGVEALRAPYRRQMTAIRP